MERKIIYLINPIAGTRGKSSLLDLIKQKTGEKGIEFDIIHTNPSGDYSFLEKKIREDRVTDIVVCGGDGTVNAVFSALTDTEVNAGIIPMGSGNGLALSAKIPTQPSKALELIFSGKASYIDCFYINERFSCMLCGIGFDGLVAHEFAKQPARGLKTYIKTSLAHFFRAKPYPFEIHLNDRSYAARAFFISVANSNQFGNHVTIAPKASLSDGLLDIVIVKEMNKFRLTFTVLSQVLGLHAINKSEDIAGPQKLIYFQTPALTILNPSKAPLHIDGEPKDTAEIFSIRIFPRALKLIQPNS